MRVGYALLLTVGACGFSLRPEPGQSNDAASDRDAVVSLIDAPDIDAQMVSPLVPLHVPSGGQAPGTKDLVVTATIDTGALTVDGVSSLPAGITFDSWSQVSGVDLAVLHVKKLTVPMGANVRVTGSRALVVVAGDDIAILGVLLGGARRDVAGPGGAAVDLGTGRGAPGGHVSTYRDSGGSGAGFASAGGTGGAGGTSCTPNAVTVAAGVPYGDPQLMILVAGSGGGTAYNTSCGIRPAGAGGGAIQLSSATRVVITGGIDVGGGGGGGGRSLTSPTNCNMGAGSGGGSGGSIVLQAPVVNVSGTLTANGGAGGSSAGDPNGDNALPVEHGVDGQDGQRGTTAAIPGPDVGVWSSAGGAGGARSSSAVGGADNADCDGNGGGGGGAVGRMVISVAPTTGVVMMTGIDSPAYVPATY